MADWNFQDALVMLKSTQNVDFLRQVLQVVNARLADLEEAEMGGKGAQMVRPHVQPTDEYRAGHLFGQSLAGPQQGR